MDILYLQINRFRELPVCIAVQQTLVRPEVSGLDNDDNDLIADEPTGIDYSSPWHESYVTHREEIKQNLHILHPSMQTVLRMCQETLGKMLLCDCSHFRYITMRSFPTSSVDLNRLK